MVIIVSQIFKNGSYEEIHKQYINIVDDNMNIDYNRLFTLIYGNIFEDEKYNIKVCWDATDRVKKIYVMYEYSKYVYRYFKIRKIFNIDNK
jgi:hypothetical protein